MTQGPVSWLGLLTSVCQAHAVPGTALASPRTPFTVGDGPQLSLNLATPAFGDTILPVRTQQTLGFGDLAGTLGLVGVMEMQEAQVPPLPIAWQDRSQGTLGWSHGGPHVPSDRETFDGAGRLLGSWIIRELMAGAASKKVRPGSGKQLSTSRHVTTSLSHCRVSITSRG